MKGLPVSSAMAFFSHVFQNIVGVLPSEYLKQHSGKESY
jgi:hypothetical protein